MGRGRRGTGEALILRRAVQRTLFSPNASGPMFQNPRGMGQSGTWRFDCDVPGIPGFGTGWNMTRRKTV